MLLGIIPIDVDQGQIILLGRAVEDERESMRDIGTGETAGLHKVIVPDFVIQRTRLLNGGWHGGR